MAKAEAADWEPILHELLNVQRKDSMRTYIHRENMEIGTYIAIPLSVGPGEKWTDVMDRFFGQKAASADADPTEPDAGGAG